MAFSERMGLRKPRDVVQLDSMDANLRMGIYNFLYDRFIGQWRVQNAYAAGHSAARLVWTIFWHLPADQFSHHASEFCNTLKRYVNDAAWNDVYELLEFISADTSLRLSPDALNPVLQREMSGYRLVAGCLTPISDPVELAAVRAALLVPEPFAGARKHLVDALDKLGHKPQPDVRNAITEAVSAVEAAARVVTGKKSATLGDALKVLEGKHGLHTALKEAWLKLYGYTSDEQGLRHAMTEDPQIDFETAKYMVVSCAAFVNLLSTLPPKS